jgi:hypothetical protein
MFLAAERSQRLLSAASRLFVRYASKKQGGSTSNGRDSAPKFLGLKAGGGEVRCCKRVCDRERRARLAAPAASPTATVVLARAGEAIPGACA